MCTFNDFKNLRVSIVLLLSQASEKQSLEVAKPQKSPFRQLKKLLVRELIVILALFWGEFAVHHFKKLV